MSDRKHAANTQPSSIKYQQTYLLFKNDVLILYFLSSWKQQLQVQKGGQKTSGSSHVCFAGTLSATYLTRPDVPLVPGHWDLSYGEKRPPKRYLRAPNTQHLPAMYPVVDRQLHTHKRFLLFWFLSTRRVSCFRRRRLQRGLQWVWSIWLIDTQHKCIHPLQKLSRLPEQTISMICL